jgi:hypothetical protein
MLAFSEMPASLSFPNDKKIIKKNPKHGLYGQ